MVLNKFIFPDYKMPLINDFRSGDGYYTTKQITKLYDSAYVNPLVVSEEIKHGEGIFSGLGSLINTGVNFVKANKDLIQAGAQSAGSVIQAGKNINDAHNSTRKANAEVDYVNKLKRHIALLNKEKEAALSTKGASEPSAPKPDPNGTPSSSLSKVQEDAIKESLKNMSANKKPRGKGFRVY